jgi:hypothetical protein
MAPEGVACSPSCELVVADTKNKCVRLFSDTGVLLQSFAAGYVTGVVVLGGTVLAQDMFASKCSFYS